MRGKIFLGLGAASLMAMASAANAAIVTLQSKTPSGSNFIYEYQGTLGPDEGVRTGDKLVIYDFTGYVDGSIFSFSPNITASTELTTIGLIDPSQSDDASLTNLVFTYNGPDFRNVNGPYAPFDWDGLGAASIFATTRLDAFTTITTKNNPELAENTAVTTLGLAEVPGIVPEPASWMMMIGGFGVVGFAARRRRSSAVSA